MYDLQIDFTRLSDKELEEFREDMEQRVERELERREKEHRLNDACYPHWSLFVPELQASNSGVFFFYVL